MEALGSETHCRRPKNWTRAAMSIRSFTSWLEGLAAESSQAMPSGLDLEAGWRYEDVRAALHCHRSQTASPPTPVADSLGARMKSKCCATRRAQRTQTSTIRRSTRHIEVKLADGNELPSRATICASCRSMTEAVVERLLNRFNLDRDTYIRVESRSEMRGPFPSGSTFSVLQPGGEGWRVASQSPSRKDIAMMARLCRNARIRKSSLEALAAACGRG